MADLVTPQGVSLMLNDPTSSTSIVVQVLEIKPVVNNRYTCMVTDGKMKTKAMLPTRMSLDVETGKIQDMGLIRVHSYTSNAVPNQPNKALIITNCEIVRAALDHEIGESRSDDKKPEIDLKPKLGEALVKSAAQIVQEQHGSAVPAARMGISRRVYPLMSLTPYQGNWTIKVRVTSKGPLRTYRNARGEGSVFNVELTDEDGTQIQATMFKEAAEKFYTKFELGRIYYISKGMLRMANRQFSTVNNNYEMTLNASSEVEEAVEEDGKASQIPSMIYNFVKIDDLGPYVNTKELIDVIGVVQSVSPTVSVRRKSDNSEFAKREITIVDQGQKTVVISLWSALALEEGAKLVDMAADAPIVLVKSLRVNDFQGVSLSTSIKSMVWINPETPEARELRLWYDQTGKEANMTSVGASMPGGSLKAGSRSAYDDRALLSDITLPSVGEEKAAYFNVRGYISYIKPDQAMWYMACSTCNRKVTEDSSRFWCEGCQLHFDTCSRRYIMLAKISDSSGEAWVSAFNEQAEQILGVAADTLADMKSQDEDQKLYQGHLKNATWASRVFRVSVAQTEYMSEKRQRITVRAVNQIDWSAESNLLLDRIAKLKSNILV